jgi:hypothetical protein
MMEKVKVDPGGKAPAEGKTVHVTIRLSGELLEAINGMGKKECRSTSSMIRVLLHRAVMR